MMTGATTAQAWREWEGQVIDGKFPLLQHLGSGERSGVFLTERAEGQRAAIKIVPASETTVNALLTRWQAGATLDHPHILRLFETGSASLGDVSFAYVVMEYAEENLSQVDRPLTEAETIDMLDGVLKAFDHLHGNQLAHGHLKPSNVLAVADQLKISGDTIRPAGQRDTSLDFPGPYDPPEIARQGASAAGDVWSLGVVLVEAATRQMPSWDQGEVAAPVLDALPPLLRVPVSSCLRHDPDRRWTAEELAKFLRRNAHAELVSPRPKSAVAATRTVGKRPYILPLVIAAAIFLVIALTLAVRRAPPPTVAPRELKSATPADSTIPRAEPSPSAVPKPAGKVLGQEILTRVLPDVPAKARNTIQGKVIINIRIRVNSDGSVVEARNESSASSRFFGNLALQGARRWKFAPDPTRSADLREWTLRFQFVRDPQHPVSVQALPVR